MAGFKSDWNSDIDLSGLNNIFHNTSKLVETPVEYGYYEEDAHPESELNMAQLARIHQYGAKNSDGSVSIPPRPFMTQSVFMGVGDIKKEAAKAIRNAVRGRVAATNKNLEELGNIGIDSIQKALDFGKFKKLSPITIRIKSTANRPYPEKALIASGALYSGAKYKIGG